MGLVSFMAALIFFLGTAGFDADPAQAAGLPGSFSSSSGILLRQGEPDSVAVEDHVTGPVLGFHEMIFLHNTVRQKAGNQTRFVSAGDRAFFLGNTRLNAMGSFPEVFGYANTPASVSTSYRFFPRSFEEDRCTGTSKEISKSEIMNTLKEGMHRVLKINPRYNPFLWRHLVKASLGKYSFGLDARIGSTMYVSPKITWSQNLAGWPVNTELKWVPVLRATGASDKGSYVMLKLRVKF
jgi:hypothetical protein